jgi:hypothetical protein
VKHLDLNDFQRLSNEIGSHTESSEAWAESVGLNPELVESIGDVITNMAYEKASVLAQNAFLETGFDEENGWEEEDAVEALRGKVNIGGVIKDACIAAFALGFECHKQFGGSTADLPEWE